MSTIETDELSEVEENMLAADGAMPTDSRLQRSNRQRAVILLGVGLSQLPIWGEPVLANISTSRTRTNKSVKALQ